MNGAHILVTAQPLPERATPQERMQNAAHDVREAMMLVDRRLRDKAQEMDMDVDEEFANDTDNRFAVTQRTVMGRLRVVPRA